MVYSIMTLLKLYWFDSRCGPESFRKGKFLYMHGHRVSSWVLLDTNEYYFIQIDDELSQVIIVEMFIDY